MTLVKVTPEMTFVDFNKGFMQLIEETSDFLPIVSSIKNWVDHRNFRIRINQNEIKIKQILLSVPSSNADFFYSKLTPLVFEKIMNDH